MTNRPDYWKDDMEADVKRRPSEGREGRDRRDHMGQPTVISQVCTACLYIVGRSLRPGECLVLTQ